MKSNTREACFGTWWWIAIGVLVFLKLWLVAGQTIRVTWPAPSDDWLFLSTAEHLLKGEWLGPYNALTLSKGPFLSFFIAAAYVLMLPYSIAKGLLYAGACTLLVVSLGPLVRRCAWRFGFFAVLLFNPVTYDSHEYMRVWRQSLQSSLAILILAGVVALYVRREQPLRRLWPWAMLLGLALPAFWLTREESVWLLPSLGAVWVYLLWTVWRQASGERKARFGLVIGLPVLLWVAGLSIVSFLNWQHYGVFTTCEMKHGSFKAAYGSLLRVRHEKVIPFIPVPREARERIYAVSPTFLELRPYLEGKLGEAYAANSAFFTGIPAEQREIAGGWFVWALREAVELSGRGRTGAGAAAFYAQLAREVNTACDHSLLPAGGKRSGFLPALRWDQKRDIAASMWKGIRLLFLFGGMEIVNHEPSEGTPEVLARFKQLTRDRLKPLASGPSIPVAQQQWDRPRMGVLEMIHRAYVWVMPLTGAASLLALLATVVLAMRQRRLSFLLVLSLGCVGSLLAMVGIVALINVTSYPTLEDCMYLVGGYSLWIICQFTSWFALTEVLGLAGKAVVLVAAQGDRSAKMHSPSGETSNQNPASRGDSLHVQPPETSQSDLQGRTGN